MRLSGDDDDLIDGAFHLLLFVVEILSTLLCYSRDCSCFVMRVNLC